jgi:phosphate starvation-inducible PhoH-like protein
MGAQFAGGNGERDLTGIRGQSAPGQRRGARPQTDKSRIVVPFEDNRLLSNLLGEYDSNLALLEDRLGIEAHAHGNVIILTGSDTNCQIAREVLEELYKLSLIHI